MKKLILVLSLLAGCIQLTWAQSSALYDQPTTKTSAFGFRAGPLIGLQRWDNLDQGPLLNWHGMVFTESVSEDDQFNVFAQLGYHARGSALRNRRFFFDGVQTNLPAQEFIFRNVVLSLGGKSKLKNFANGRAYYSFGVRGEYTVSTNLAEYDSFGAGLTFPGEDWVNDWNYGVIFGGGWDLPLSELIGATIELTINQDFSFQYRQPAIGNIPSPFQPGQTVSVGERSIRNTTIELSVGLRFLRIVEYR